MAIETIEIGKVCQVQNVGFVRTLLMIDIADLVSMEDPQMGIPASVYTAALNKFVFVENVKVYKMMFPTKACVFSENETIQLDGRMYGITLDWALPKISAEFKQWFYANRNRRWLVLIEDSNGSCYVLGEPENGLFLSSSQAINTVNRISMQLVGRTWHSAWMLDSIDLDTLGLNTEFNLDFNLDFRS